MKEDYLACLKQHSNDAEKCREVAKLYLECRMERCGQHHDENMGLVWKLQSSRFNISFITPCRNLMAKQDLKHLGFREQAPAQSGSQ